MTIIGIDDTDSAEQGMCTTYVGHKIAEEITEKHDNVSVATHLIRLNPAAPHKTRGNAAVAIHTDLDIQPAMEITDRLVKKYSYPEDPETNPGAIAIDEPPQQTTDATEFAGDFARRAMREILGICVVDSILEQHKHTFHTVISKGNGRGRIGALAAIGAHTVFDEITYESITYRESEYWGTDRSVDIETVHEAHEVCYPDVWDNYDPVTSEAVCVPNTPCPVLYGIRGDDAGKVERARSMIDAEHEQSSQLFVTNQGTDAHIAPGIIGELQPNESYEVSGIVASEPSTEEGGHVFFDVHHPSDSTEKVTVAAFEPTKRFRDDVRDLRPGDELKLYGEMSDGTLKLEKFQVESLNKTQTENPYCDECERSMGSMGADQGYRCPNCKSTQPSKVKVPIARNLSEEEWYEVPPVARRHLAEPVIRMDKQKKTLL